MAKMWAGRFQKEENAQVNDFNSSISFDQRMYRDDIDGSIAHATMLGEQGIIAPEEAAEICRELGVIRTDLDEGRLEIDPAAEDIHMFIEAELTARLGDTGKRLHTARSRNDQVALDIRTNLRGEIPQIQGLLRDLTELLCRLAGEHTRTVMPGYTHHLRASPDGLCADVPAGLRPAFRLLEADEYFPLGKRCAGGDDLSAEPGTCRRAAGL